MLGLPRLFFVLAVPYIYRYMLHPRLSEYCMAVANFHQIIMGINVHAQEPDLLDRPWQIMLIFSFLLLASANNFGLNTTLLAKDGGCILAQSLHDFNAK